MKQTILFAILLVTSIFIKAQQKDSIQLQQLKSPISPGFSLLDISPTSIESPTSPKMIAINFINAIQSGNGGLPKNFALEVSPYWVLKHRNETIFKYLGLADNRNSNITSGILRKMSISVATYFNDSAKNFITNTNYVSVGVRTNLLTIWGKAASSKAKSFLVSRNVIRRSLEADIDDPNLLRRTIDSLYAINNVQAFSVKPLFVLDGAFATSESFKENDYNKRRFNRSAFWLNATFSSATTKQNEDNFFIILYFRYMRDNVLKDTTAAIFIKENASDIGFRAGYERGRLSLSFEHISRKYKDYELINSKRTIGILQFKINDNLHLTGTFGKNFTKRENLFTALGLNWGIGKQALALE